MTEVAEELTVATGRPISHRARTPEQERSSLSAAGGAEWRVELTVSRSAAVAAGEMDVVSDTVPRLTGHPSQTFSGYLRQHPESCDHIAAA